MPLKPTGYAVNNKCFLQLTKS